MLLSFTILSVYYWIPFISEYVSDKKYCLNNYCFSIPNGYAFSYFLGDNIESNVCYYTLSCKKVFNSTTQFNSLVFNNFIGESLTISISNKNNIVSNNSHSFNLSNCKYSIKNTQERPIIIGYFLDENRTFSFGTENQKISDMLLEDICFIPRSNSGNVFTE